MTLAFLFALQLLAASCAFAGTASSAEASGAHVASSSSPPPKENGSNAPSQELGLLGKCWSETDLKGNPKEKRASSSFGLHPDPPSTKMLRMQDFVELPEAWRNSIRRVQIRDGGTLVALTFDLCERENEVMGYDAEIVNCLRERHVKATFFASGKWMWSHPERTMQLMADPLFEVGNHGWVHENFRLLEGREAEERFLRTQVEYQLLREELAKRCCSDGACKAMEGIPAFPRIFRFPFGACNAETLNMLARYGVAAVQWDVVSGDPSKGQTDKGITEIVLRQTKPGSIVVFHANGRGHGTSTALPGLVAALRGRGFEFVTVSELLRAGTPVSSTDCYELKPHDNSRYDKFR